MADRQFTIQEILMLHKPELAIPAFTKAKDQLLGFGTVIKAY